MSRIITKLFVYLSFFGFLFVCLFTLSFIIYRDFNQSYIVTHKCCLVVKAQRISMNILFAKLKKETILYSHFPGPLPAPTKKRTIASTFRVSC